MTDRDPPFGYRIVRAGLRVASRAAGGVVDRVLRRAPAADPPRPAATRPTPPKGPRSPVHVTFVQADGEAVGIGVVERGATLLEAADSLDVDLDHFCGGNASCGTCRIEIVDGERALSRRESMEEAVLRGAARSPKNRLACQARVLGPVTVRIPEFS